MDFLKIFASGICGYLLGSIMFAVIITKARFGLDVRSQGSGNAGATNVARVFGLGSGVLTFLFDAGKTLISMAIGRWLAGEIGFAVALMACILGHCFPVFFKFKGGKGVSVGAAVGLAIDWRIFLMLLAVFIIMFLISKRISVCSLTAAVCLPFFELIVGYDDALYLTLGIFASFMVLIMHRENIKRLIHGQESKFNPQKRGEAPRQKG